MKNLVFTGCCAVLMAVMPRVWDGVLGYLTQNGVVGWPKKHLSVLEEADTYLKP